MTIGSFQGDEPGRTRRAVWSRRSKIEAAIGVSNALGRKGRNRVFNAKG